VTAPRIFGIPARDAPVVAVLRRGPSDWFHLSRWDVATLRYEPGAWLRGTVYAQRCDLSPDGRWFAYFALKAGADWAPGPTYVAVSRLPWLTALAAWGTGGTWTRGVHFVDAPDATRLDPPDMGSLEGMPATTGLAVTRAASFAVERRRGWTETGDTPPRGDHDAWDEQRDVSMEKADPAGSGARLVVSGRYAAFRDFGPERFTPARYELVVGAEPPRLLAGVQWAEWSPVGGRDRRLLVATTDGRLQVRDVDGEVVHWERDLAGAGPDPQPPPLEASRW